MNDQAFYRVSVKGVAFDENGRFLLAREGNNKWELLGGGLDHGEDPRVCLNREIQEETGLKVMRITERPLHFLTAPSYSGNFQTANIIYQIELENLNFVPSGECQELRYFNVEEAKKLDCFPNVERFIDYLATRE